MSHGATIAPCGRGREWAASHVEAQHVTTWKAWKESVLPSILTESFGLAWRCAGLRRGGSRLIAGSMAGYRIRWWLRACLALSH